MKPQLRQVLVLGLILSICLTPVRRIWAASSTPENLGEDCGGHLVVSSPIVNKTPKPPVDAETLPLVPGPLVELKTSGVNAFSYFQLAGVDLDFGKGADLENIAEILGRSSDAVIILNRIQELASQGIYKVPLQEFLPAIARELTNVEGRAFPGANCFNAVICWHDENWPRQLNSPTPERLLRHGFFRLNQDEPLRYGDVLAFYDGPNSVRHTVIYLTKGLVWHKPDPGSQPWAFDTLERVASGQMQIYRFGNIRRP